MAGRVGAVSGAHDRKAAEEALRLGRDSSARLSEIKPDAILTIDEEGSTILR